MNRRATWHRVAASVVVALCVGALPAMVSAANLCFTLADGSTVVLVNFKVKKGGASFARGTDGKLAGGGNTFYRTFHSVRLDAGSDGKIGDGGTGYDERFYTDGFGSNGDLGVSNITATVCPKDLGSLGMPTGN